MHGNALHHEKDDRKPMQNRQSGRRRRGSGGANPRPMGQPMGGQGANRLEVRVRGNAHQLLEKYKQLARDAHQSGDRVATEYYLQHADHYFRVLNDTRIRQEEMRARRGMFDQYEEDMTGGEADAQNSGDGNEESGEPQADRARPDRPERQDRDRRQRDGGRAERGERTDRPERAERPEREEGDGGRRQRARHDEQTGERDTQAPESRRVRPRAAVQPVSDGEAALVAFGGVPVREDSQRDDAGSAAVAPREAEAVAEEEPAPRKRPRGRPRKVEATPVDG